jgi:phage tail-like protein
MAPVKPITQQQFLVTLKGFDYYFQKFSGLTDSSQVTEYNDGLSNRTRKLVGPKQVETFTLEKAFDPLQDDALVQWYKTFCDGNTDGETVSVTPVSYCPEPEPIGKSLVFYNCRPSKLEGFQVDRTSQNVATLMIEFMADDWEYA